MKKIICLVLLLIFGSVIQEVDAKKINKRSTRQAKKEAKSLAKEGWEVTPGSIPLAKQLDKSWAMQYDVDEQQMPKYLFSEAMSVAQTYNAAKMQAVELAKLSLVAQVESNIVAIIETNLANNQLSADEAATITSTVAASKNMITQKLGRILLVIEAYRTLETKHSEVLVRIAYSAEEAQEATKDVLRQEMVDKSVELQAKLDKMLGIE